MPTPPPALLTLLRLWGLLLLLLPVTVRGQSANHSLCVHADGTLWAWGLNGYGQLGDGTRLDRSVPTQIGMATNWLAAATGEFHSVAVRRDGTLWTWGDNSAGQLGNGRRGSTADEERHVPEQVGTRRDWQSVAAGNRYTLAIRRDGTLWAWGHNRSGQLGDGSTTGRNAPVQVGTVADWQAVSAGTGHTLALRRDGSLWAWGIPIGAPDDTTIQTSPMQLAPAFTWRSIAAGANFALAIRRDGSLWAWGYNYFGQLGDGSTLNRRLPVPVGTEHRWQSVAAGTTGTAAISRDGSLWAWGRTTGEQEEDVQQVSAPVRMGTTRRWRSVTAGYAHFTGLQRNGSLWAWGSNSNGQVGSTQLSMLYQADPVQVGTDSTWQTITAAANHTLAIKRDGSLWAWGANSGQLGDGMYVAPTRTVRSANDSLYAHAFFRAPVRVGTGNAWLQVTTGAAHTAALRRDGTLWTWGHNTSGELGLGAGAQLLYRVPQQVGPETDWQRVTAGAGRTFALRRDGSLWAWGQNLYGELGNGTTTDQNVPVPVAAGSAGGWQCVAPGSAQTVAIRRDGSLWTWGRNVAATDYATSTTPVQMGSGTDWQQVVGSLHFVLLRRDGTLWAWGSNTYGQLGSGSCQSSSVPQQVGAAADWRTMAAGAYHTAAIRRDGTLWAWGSHTYGALFEDSAYCRRAPEPIAQAFRWRSVVAGATHTVALRQDGTLWAWGNNQFGQLGRPISSCAPLLIGNVRGSKRQAKGPRL
ncbi:hypothetical protein LJ737_04475 [Hymenobacter sp. 15J16-1T3B]|uniref:RCC1 domain-containing protein n=1 Tax=Hymenobacter sp. 15J16-1T3B TaxID=2886941 RepID=UPI001D12894E|nr:hypothetical protein [Hymenobacter sp. 15J16-1T3B]MCC3156479.1 hypothetical protein [Hymenobacter sp. 15J16-1T3B]